LTTMDERGTAVGFSDTKVKEGVGPVGVGNKVPVTVAPETLEAPDTPETLEPAGTEAPEEATEAAVVPAAEEAAALDEATS
jgi:hypothetical protein